MTKADESSLIIAENLRNALRDMEDRLIMEVNGEIKSPAPEESNVFYIREHAAITLGRVYERLESILSDDDFWEQFDHKRKDMEFLGSCGAGCCMNSDDFLFEHFNKMRWLLEKLEDVKALAWEEVGKE